MNENKYILPTILLFAATIISGAIFFLNIDNDSLLFVTMPVTMVLGMLTFISFMWAAKRTEAAYLSDLGFDIDRTLVMSTIGFNLMSRTKTPSYILAFELKKDELRVAQVKVTIKKEVLNVHSLPVSSLKKIIFEKELDSTACYLVIEGLHQLLTPDLQNKRFQFNVLSPNDENKYRVAHAVNSRNHFDTQNTVLFLQQLSRTRNIEIEDRRNKQ